MEKVITIQDIKEAMDYIEKNKPKCNNCGTAFDSYFGVLGFNCKCGCDRDAKSPAGRDCINIIDNLIE